MDCSPPGSSVHGKSPGKNTGVGCHFLLQGIFWTQGSKLCLLKFLQGNKAVLSHFTQISVSEIPFSTHVARNWAFSIISFPVLIWNEWLPYCDTRVILQREFSKRRRIKTKKEESSTCGPQVCRWLKLDGKWRRRTMGAVSPLEVLGGLGPL